MKDFWHSFTKWSDHLRYYFLIGALCFAASSSIIGCAYKTDSLINPGTKVTDKQLAVEVAFVNRGLAARGADIKAAADVLEAERAELGVKLEVGKADLAEQKERREQIASFAVNALGQVAQGNLSPTAIASLAGTAGLITFGLGGLKTKKRDNGVIVEKDTEIAMLKAENSRLESKVISAQ